MLFECLTRLFAFDIGWWTQLFLGNLHWVFAMVAYFVITKGEKAKIFPGFIFLMGMLYALFDFFALSGKTSFTRGNMFVWMLFKMPLLVFISGTALEKHSSKLLIFFLITFTFLFC